MLSVLHTFDISRWQSRCGVNLPFGCLQKAALAAVVRALQITIALSTAT